jgi:hypothetical protein
LTATPVSTGFPASGSSSRHDGVTITCPACGQQFTPAGRQRWCSGRCRAAGYRRRKQAAGPDVVLPAPRPRRPRTVYACDACGSRSLGTQYCQDCQTFMRRVGLGAPCPCCDEPVAALELVPEAAEHHG